MNSELTGLANEIRAWYGKEFCEIQFFGSRARGDALPESDYDCLLIFRHMTPDVKKSLDRLSADWLLNRGIVFSWVAVSEADLENLRYEPFLQNARREGIAA